MDIRFTDHALAKFEVLRRHGFALDPSVVEDTVRRPSRVLTGYHGRRIAQGPLDAERILRVVYEESASELTIVTFYPGKRTRYD